MVPLFYWAFYFSQKKSDMRLLLTGLMILFVSSYASAQPDLLLLRKHDKTVRHISEGAEIAFATATRYFDAIVEGVANDSLYLLQYDIRKVPTTLGFFMFDTVATYHFGVPYRDIISIQKDKANFDWKASGAALFGGGTILTTAGLLSWVLAKPNTRYYARPSLVIAGAAAAGIGYLLMHSGNRTIKLGKKYSLKYVNLK